MNNWKSQPHSVEAEQALLGMLLLQYRSFEEIEDIITKKEMLYAPEHQTIFSTIAELYQQDKVIDYISVADVLERKSQLEYVGGSKYLESLSKSVLSTSNLSICADIIKENYVLRSMIKIGYDMMQNGYNTHGKSIDELLEIVEKNIYSIRNESVKEDLPEFGNILQEFLDDLHKKSLGDHSSTIATGITALDEVLLGGFEKGDLVIVAGRPAMGKTTIVTQMITNMLSAKKSVIVLSLEMSYLQMTRKIASNLVKIPSKILKQGGMAPSDFDKMFDFVDSYKGASLHFMPSKSPTITSVKSYTRKIATKIIAKKLPELGCLVIDYLGLMQHENKTANLAQALAEITRELKLLAQEMRIPIILISQLNRGVELRANKRPTMADLRDSGAIEQDADKILLLYREDYYKSADEKKDNKTTIIVAKNRDGDVDDVNLHYQANSGTLDDKKEDDFQYQRAGDK
jgi:replicative DNA helicase